MRRVVVELFASNPGNKYELLESDFTDFESSIIHADLVITDYNHDKVDSAAGLRIYEKIRDSKFAPVIIYSGFVQSIDRNIVDFQGPFLRVIEKGARSSDSLVATVNEIVESKEFQVKKSVEEELLASVNKNFREYYWNHVQKHWNSFENLDSDVLKRVLSRKIIKDIHPLLIEGDNIHPIEFYEHPVADAAKIETGSILKKDEHYFICVTNDCDLEVRSGNTCNATKICLLKVSDLKAGWYADNADVVERLKKNTKLLNNNSEISNTRFILPRTFFFDGGYVHFEQIIIKDVIVEDGKIKLDDIGVILAKVHSPFIQRLIANFARHYSRVGTPDMNISSCLPT